MRPELLDMINSILPLGLFIKIVLALFLLMHLAFSILAYRQTQLMNRVVEARISPVISLVALSHLIFSVITLLVVVFLL